MDSNTPLWAGRRIQETATGRTYHIQGFTGIGTVFIRAEEGKDEREIPVSELREWYEVVE